MDGMRGVNFVAGDLRRGDGEERWDGCCDIRGRDDRARTIVIDRVELRDRQFGGGWKLTRENLTLCDGGVDIPSLNQELQSEKQHKDEAALCASCV